ncbi:hypothetical protein GPECTOR_53g149 [Gonium pectorale]|uniref:BEACH domain-containing protein n=1 Tax=Gonium pectorale TaxID=33097 RepID=A0A150G719_GONPE|nr:hypothetical protein GPECTOR_53g149 [Gonium pectorale]|eukprot:KXZ45563.1 hypothetical protein GPECTOR_53g149 [Gonium pectorale]
MLGAGPGLGPIGDVDGAAACGATASGRVVGFGGGGGSNTSAAQCGVGGPEAATSSGGGGASSGAGWHDLTQSRYRQAKGDLQLDVTYASSDVPHHIPQEPLSELSYCIYMARVTPRAVLQRAVRANFEPREYPACLPAMLARSPDECLPQLYTDPSVFRSIHPELPDLQLPPWAASPEEFIRWHRELLESDHVSSQIHHWVDLMFGYKLAIGQIAVQLYLGRACHGPPQRSAYWIRLAARLPAAARRFVRLCWDPKVTAERLLCDSFFGPELHAAHSLLRTTVYLRDIQPLSPQRLQLPATAAARASGVSGTAHGVSAGASAGPSGSGGVMGGGRDGVALAALAAPPLTRLPQQLGALAAAARSARFDELAERRPALELCLPHIMHVLWQAAAFIDSLPAAPAAPAGSASAQAAFRLCTEVYDVLLTLVRLLPPDRVTTSVLPYVCACLSCFTEPEAAAAAPTAAAASHVGAAPRGGSLALPQRLLSAQLHVALLGGADLDTVVQQVLPLLVGALLHLEEGQLPHPPAAAATAASGGDGDGQDPDVSGAMRARRPPSDAGVSPLAAATAMGGDAAIGGVARALAVASVSDAAAAALVAMAGRMPLPLLLERLVGPLLSSLTLSTSVPRLLVQLCAEMGGRLTARHVAPALLRLAILPARRGAAAAGGAGGGGARGRSITSQVAAVMRGVRGGDDSGVGGARGPEEPGASAAAPLDPALQRQIYTALSVLTAVLDLLPREFVPRVFLEGLATPPAPSGGVPSPPPTPGPDGSALSQAPTSPRPVTGAGAGGAAASGTGATAGVGGCLPPLLSCLLDPTAFLVAPGSLTMLAALVLRAFVRLARPENLAWVLVPHLAPLLEHAAPRRRAAYRANGTARRPADGDHGHGHGAATAAGTGVGSQPSSVGSTGSSCVTPRMSSEAGPRPGAVISGGGGGGSAGDVRRASAIAAAGLDAGGGVAVGGPSGAAPQPAGAAEIAGATASTAAAVAAEAGDPEDGYWELVHCVYGYLVDSSGLLTVRTLLRGWKALEEGLSARLGWSPAAAGAWGVSSSSGGGRDADGAAGSADSTVGLAAGAGPTARAPSAGSGGGGSGGGGGRVAAAAAAALEQQMRQEIANKQQRVAAIQGTHLFIKEVGWSAPNTLAGRTSPKDVPAAGAAAASTAAGGGAVRGTLSAAGEGGGGGGNRSSRTSVGALPLSVPDSGEADGYVWPQLLAIGSPTVVEGLAVRGNALSRQPSSGSAAPSIAMNGRRDSGGPGAGGTGSGGGATAEGAKVKGAARASLSDAHHACSATAEATQGYAKAAAEAARSAADASNIVRRSRSAGGGSGGGSGPVPVGIPSRISGGGAASAAGTQAVEAASGGQRPLGSSTMASVFAGSVVTAASAAAAAADLGEAGPVNSASTPGGTRRPRPASPAHPALQLAPACSDPSPITSPQAAAHVPEAVRDADRTVASATYRETESRPITPFPTASAPLSPVNRSAPVREQLLEESSSGARRVAGAGPGAAGGVPALTPLLIPPPLLPDGTAPDTGSQRWAWLPPAHVQYGGHRAAVQSLLLLRAARAGGAVVASLDAAGQLHLWSYDSGQQLACFAPAAAPGVAAGSGGAGAGSGSGGAGGGSGGAGGAGASAGAGGGGGSGGAEAHAGAEAGSAWSDIVDRSGHYLTQQSSEALGWQFMGGLKTSSQLAAATVPQPAAAAGGGGSIGAQLSAASLPAAVAATAAAAVAGGGTLRQGYTVMCGAVDEHRTLYAGTADARLCMLDIERGRVVAEWLAAPAVRIDPDDAISALCTPGGGSDVAGGGLAGSLPAATPASSLFSPEVVVAGSRGGRVVVLDRRCGTAASAFRAHSGEVTAMASYGSHVVLTAGADKLLRVWDLRRCGAGGGGLSGGVAGAGGLTGVVGTGYSSRTGPWSGWQGPRGGAGAGGDSLWGVADALSPVGVGVALYGNDTWYGNGGAPGFVLPAASPSFASGQPTAGVAPPSLLRSHPLPREGVQGLDATFHRAFDMTEHPLTALDDLVSLGIPRVLTSGCQPTAMQGAETLAALVARAAGRISVMAGGGVTAGNAAELVRLTGVTELHSSAKRRQLSPMTYRRPGMSMAAPRPAQDYEWNVADEEAVHQGRGKVCLTQVRPDEGMVQGVNLLLSIRLCNEKHACMHWRVFLVRGTARAAVAAQCGLPAEPVLEERWSDLDVAVVGGGPAGLAAALALLQVLPDLRLKVFEASPAYTHQGAGVGLAANGAKALEALNPTLLHRLLHDAVFLTSSHIYNDQSGERMPWVADNAPLARLQQDGFASCLVPWNSLRTVLYGALPPGVVEFGCKVTGCEALGSARHELEVGCFAPGSGSDNGGGGNGNGSTEGPAAARVSRARARYVIAADGYFSRIRRTLCVPSALDTHAAAASGTTAPALTCFHSWQPVSRDAPLRGPPPRALNIYASGLDANGVPRYVWSLYAPVAALEALGQAYPMQVASAATNSNGTGNGTGRRGRHALLRALAVGAYLPPDVRATLAATPPGAVMEFGMHTHPADSYQPGAWARGRLLLVGDAAHAGWPDGQGANTALEDAAVLGALVRQHGLGEQVAFVAWEACRLPRVRAILTDTPTGPEAATRRSELIASAAFEPLWCPLRQAAAAMAAASAEAGGEAVGDLAGAADLVERVAEAVAKGGTQQGREVILAWSRALVQRTALDKVEVGAVAAAVAAAVAEAPLTGEDEEEARVAVEMAADVLSAR